MSEYYLKKIFNGGNIPLLTGGVSVMVILKTRAENKVIFTGNARRCSMVLNHISDKFDIEKASFNMGQAAGRSQYKVIPIEAGLRIRERIPVWQAISRLWLVQVLSDSDLKSIAHILADSSFDLPDIERICVYEVAPVVHENLRHQNGVWGTFDAAWLITSIEQNIRNAFFRQEAIRKREYMMELVSREWDTIKKYVKEIRSANRLSAEEQNGLLRLMQSPKKN